MNLIDKEMQTKWVALKAGIFEIGRKFASPGLQERVEDVRNTRDLNLPLVEMPGDEYPTGRIPQGKKRGNDYVVTQGKYVLRPRLSWTGVYGKAPWPRERKQWEKI